MILNLKKSNELTDDLFQNMISKFHGEVDEIERQIYEDKGYSEFFVQDWMNKFKDDPEIKKQFEMLKSI